MILQSLVGLYDRLADNPEKNIPHYGFTDAKASWRLVISDDGELVDVDDIRQVVKVGKTTKILPVVERVPDCGVRTSGVSPNVLCDGPAYFFGYVPEEKKPDPKRERTLARARECFEASKLRHLKLEPKIAHPSFSAVCRFFEHWNPDEAASNSLLGDKWDDLAGSNLVFRLDGDIVDVHRINEVREAWLTVKTTEDDDGPVEGQCLVSGGNGLLERVHSSIKGVRGAQSSGAAVVSFNSSAFTSYAGKKDSQWNAPVGKDAAFKYTTMLNWLLRNDNHRCVMIGDASTVFWSGVDSHYEPVFGHALHGDFSGQGEDAETLGALRSAMDYFAGRLSGFPEDMKTDVPFYILGLSPNAARISVRFWYASTLGEVYGNLKRFYSDLSIERSFGKEPEYPAIWQLLDETVPKKKGKPDREKLSPLLSGALAGAQLTGGDFPHAFLTAILRRISADRVVNYMRASGIKAVLTRNYKTQITLPIPMSLDTERNDTPYLLGRLFAALEKAQKDSNPSLDNTVREKYFTSASATPAIIFPRMLQLSRHHLRKLRGEKDGSWKANYDDGQIASIMEKISDFPQRLPLPEQGVFAIGYYHQRNAFYRGKGKSESSEAVTADTDSKD